MIDSPHRPLSSEPPADGVRIGFVGNVETELEDRLRAQGHEVQRVGLSFFSEEAESLPRLVVFGLGPDDEPEAVKKLFESSEKSHISVLVIVDAEGETSAHGPWLESVQDKVIRPFDVQQVVDRVTALLDVKSGATAVRAALDMGLPSQIGDIVFDEMPQVFQKEDPLLSPMVTYPVEHRTSNPPHGSSAPPGSWPSLAPEPLGDRFNRGAFAGPTSLSEELEKLLREAEDRVMAETMSGPEVPSPEAEVNAILPKEVLAALDDPLEVTDDEEPSGSESHTPVGRGTAGGYTSDGYSKHRTGTVAKELASPAEPVTAHGQGQQLPLDTGMLQVAAAQEPEPSDRQEVSERQASQYPPETQAFSQNKPVLGNDFPTPTPPSDGRVPLAETVMPVRAVMPIPQVVPSQLQVEPVRIGLPSSPAPQRNGNSTVVLPEVLTPEHDGLRVLATCIHSRVTATLCFDYEGVLCRAVMRDGDFVTCGSSADDESLLAFLVLRGDMPKEVGAQFVGKVAPFGRHAAAALIANGFLRQDQLWVVLRSHAEWLLGRMASTQGGACVLEPEPPGRLKTEPAVFGGATGSEVLVEVTQRVMPHEDAVARLGGLDARLTLGTGISLLAECALTERERALVEGSSGHTVQEVLEAAGQSGFAAVLVALQELGVIEIVASIGTPRKPESAAVDPLDAEAVRKRILARIAVIQEGDYFEVLGVSRGATAYEIRRAYLESRRSFEPTRILTAQTVDLADDARLIIEVLDEAYEVLRDETRRERYRRALEAVPPRI